EYPFQNKQGGRREDEPVPDLASRNAAPGIPVHAASGDFHSASSGGLRFERVQQAYRNQARRELGFLGREQFVHTSAGERRDQHGFLGGRRGNTERAAVGPDDGRSAEGFRGRDADRV